MSVMTKVAMAAMEKGLLTDGWIRRGIRRLNDKRLRRQDPGDAECSQGHIPT